MAVSKRALSLLVGILAVTVSGGLRAESRVPPWDLRGSGPLPAQGIACLDVAEDGRIVLGTIASAGHPNVIVLDADGKLLEAHTVGQRWIGEVALPARTPFALCTMPAGSAEDVPTVFFCSKQATRIPSDLGQTAHPQTLFHYGDHSNHPGTFVRRADRGAVALYGTRVLWLDPDTGNAQQVVNVPRAADAVTVSLAVHGSGMAVVGCSAVSSDKGEPQNLFLMKPDAPRPVWSRTVVSEVGNSDPPEKGPYGRPTLPNGKRDELPQSDVPVFAPLSIAVDRESQLTRVATADYRGWQRWIRSSATGREQNYGTRFMPAKPAICVYDAVGNRLRRFDPSHFAKAGWVDLAFLPGGRFLLAYPHHWTCRGLAGQTVLPADEGADAAWLLDVESGEVAELKFPDAVSDAAVGHSGQIAVACWDGRVYFVGTETWKARRLPEGVDVGGPSLLRGRNKGKDWVVATTSGAVRILNADGTERQRVELDAIVERKQPAWVANAKAEPIARGLWGLPGGRVESDLGGQRVIEGPEGLILIEGHSGLSFEREWKAMEAAGLDPKQVRFVLGTHEHGDHSPGAYLWRVATGAKFVCSEEMAYTLQHHIPLCSGYGFHPPVPTDLRIKEDETLDLAGVKVRAVRIPGHTAGSMAWLFEREGKKYVAIGDLIMPDGVLGYAGSINFSAADVLGSLRKLDSLHVDFVLPGHGPITGPERYLASGISVGRHVGWGKMRPEDPDPRYLLTQKNVLVVGWNIDAASADFADFDGDGWTDVAVLVPAEEGSSIKVWLNRQGTFREKADHEIAVSAATGPSKLRVCRLNDDGVPDFLVGGTNSALLVSRGKFPDFDVMPLGLGDANRAIRADLLGDGTQQIYVDAKFGTFSRWVADKNGRGGLQSFEPKIGGPYADFRVVDVNGDGRADLVTAYGEVYLRTADGKLPAEPTQKLPLAVEKDWSSLTMGDFNNDRRVDVCLTSFQHETLRTAVYYNTGKAERPYADKADAVIDYNPPSLPATDRHPLLRDCPPTADWNGDGIDDLVIGRGQDRRIVVLLGGPKGLDLERSTTILLDYRLHYDTGHAVADFNHDGRPDIAALGYTRTGVGAGGPLAVYVYLQQNEER